MVNLVEPLGLAGILLFFAGLHLLWQAREEIFFWFAKYISIFQDSLRARSASSTSSTSFTSATSSHRPRVFRLMSGFGLLFLGPLLVLLSLLFST